MAGKLPIDKLITRSYSLDQINEAFQDLQNGKLIRGVIKI
jgi:Zn-dependent alcohol dehydrogenase